MKKILLTLLFTGLYGITMSTTYIVDINGGGQFVNIQDGITNAAYGDTVKVWPGTYVEQVSLNKEIVLMGSGYENTIITGNFEATVSVSAGKLFWFMISSIIGDGINISGGMVSNCVINACAKRGVNCENGTTGLIQNSVIVNNGSNGVECKIFGVNLIVTNCISRNNAGYGFYGYLGSQGNHISLSYSNGSGYGTNGNQGCIDNDPGFQSVNNFHITQNGSSWDTGNPTLSDPDGSRSDMGYFGGPDCPIYPTVYEIVISPNGSNINIQAKGRANY